MANEHSPDTHEQPWTTSVSNHEAPTDLDASSHDCEKAAKVLETANVTGFTSEEEEDEEYTVDWDGPADPANPRNWSPRKKWAIVIKNSALTLCQYGCVFPISLSVLALNNN